MEPILDVKPAFSECLQSLVGKKIRIRYQQRPEGGGIGNPHEGTLVLVEGGFLKLGSLQAYPHGDFGARSEVLVALSCVATIEEIQ